ncbi:putative quinol monooxygenase [Bacillus pretiosus]|uniref:putative quinol monooxygenase n=1 Tax=Bacillus TaxID=1386 RepID=UPI000D08A96A|nr:putative quinol monooxygenase [Bacillus wiedmannii]AZJ19083.1 antibiotic biosynthesis monooxygenase [Bacillus wiedmannii bv. thuringiensis]PRT20914.1 antibiotic biosynthesis monooxygenase [Bacillus wiedmannii]
MSKFGLYGKFIVEERNREELTNILLEAAESMKALHSCEVYIVSTSDDEPNAVYVFEVWSNEEAHKASLTLESTQNLMKRAKPMITGAERISTLNARGGKGLE